MTWGLIGASIQGYSHLRSNKKNQDSFNIFPNEPITSPPIIFALSDGHGGEKYYRSDIGSKLAVESAIEILTEFTKSPLIEEINTENIEEMNKKIKNTVCLDIVKNWRKKVASQENPEDIKGDFNSIQREKNRPSIVDKQLEPYGSTLLIAVICTNCGIFIQLGDGDILFLSGKNQVERPIPKDENLIANETYSLCLPGAEHYFKVNCILFGNKNEIDNSSDPSLIMLSTDGYSNSYTSDENFEKVLIDLSKIIFENPEGLQSGIKNIKDNLESWLQETSKLGSGDDITVGLMVNLN